MAVGAYAALQAHHRLPGAQHPGGLPAGRAGRGRWWASLFGIPSLRIKGFYLAVATLAAQFFLIWLFNKVALVRELRAVGHHHRAAPDRAGRHGDRAPGDGARALPGRARVVVRASRSWPRTSCGAGWAARGWPSATATSPPRSSGSARCRPSSWPSRSARSTAAWPGPSCVFLYLGSAETLAFDINLSFLVLFMVIIGGLGSILGSFLGAAFIVLVPIFLTNAPHLLGLSLPMALQKQIELMVFGGLIVFFLIVEPQRPRPALADHQGKAAAVAVPALTRTEERPHDDDADLLIALAGRRRRRRAAGGRRAPPRPRTSSSRCWCTAPAPTRRAASRSPTASRLLHARSTSATAASTASRSPWEECETQYDTKQGVECYERLKGKSAGCVVNPYSTGHHLPAHPQGRRRQDRRCSRWATA